MNDNGSTEADKSAPPGGFISREDLLSFLSEIVKKQRKQVLNGRIRDKSTYKLRLDSIRVFSYLAATYGAILRDTDLDSINKRLETLEKNASE